MIMSIKQRKRKIEPQHTVHADPKPGAVENGDTAEIVVVRVNLVASLQIAVCAVPKLKAAVPTGLTGSGSLPLLTTES